MSHLSHIDVTSGQRISFLDPRPEQIDVIDIASGLSRIARYYGHTRRFISVAEHAVRVSRLLPKPLQLTGLLHDGSEAYIGDAHSGLKRLMPIYLRIERRWEKVIAERFGIAFPYDPAIKVADLTMLCTECRDLRWNDDWKHMPYPPLKTHIRPWSMDEAKRRFLARFKQLYKGAA